MNCDANLDYSCQLLRVLGICTRKVGQTDLVFGMRSWIDMGKVMVVK